MFIKDNILYEIEESGFRFYLFRDHYILGIYGSLNDVICGIIRDFYGKEHDPFCCSLADLYDELNCRNRICGITIREAMHDMEKHES